MSSCVCSVVKKTPKVTNRILLCSGLRQHSNKSPEATCKYDVVIGGGGVMGCSSAFFLAKRISPSSICIIERDSEYKFASTPRSVGSIRQQFSIAANIQMSMYSSRFIQNIAEHLTVDPSDPPDVLFVNGSYVFLATAKGDAILRENYETQKSQGAVVELVESSQLKTRFPWMNTDGVSAAGVGSRNEGWFDPWLLLGAFKKKAMAMGVQFINGELSSVAVDDNSVKNVQVTSSQGHKQTIDCNHLINAGGPWASDISLLAGVGDTKHPIPAMHVPLPVKPRRRCVFVVKCPDLLETNFPMLIDTSGLYVRKEGGGDTFICGVSPPEHMDEDGCELEIDYPLFEEYIWPALAHRVPAFEALKLQSAWAGYYDYNTLDQNAIIGKHPIIKNLIFANGFSGHGIQQSPAVGRAISEVILDGQSHSIDLSSFSFDRIIQNQPHKERNIV